MKGQLWNVPPVPIMRKPFVPQGEINKKDKIPGKKNSATQKRGESKKK